MKTLKSVLTVIFFCLFTALFAQQNSETYNVKRGERPPVDKRSVPLEAMEPGVLLIKFSEKHEKHLEGDPIDKNRNGNITFGIFNVDALCEQFSVKDANRLFSIIESKNSFTERHKAWGFHLWYKLALDEKTDVIALVEEFSKLPEIETAEPEYKKAPVWRSDNTINIPDNDKTIPNSKWNPNDPLFDQQWHYHNTGQNGGQPGTDIDLLNAWDLEKGNPNVIVAVIDDGIDFNHPDLAANIWSGIGYNFVDNMATIIPGFHGTHVAGTVAAVSNNNIGVAGIAGGSGSGDGVRLMSCQVYRELPDGQYLAGGFEDALIYAADQGAAIAQNSWAYTQAFVYNLAVMDAIDYFILNGGGSEISGGGVAIFAAGNNNSPAPFFPAAYPGVIGVASTNRTDQKSSFSNYGYWVSISAPGTDVLSTDVNNTYVSASGTSMACPHVSGVAALITSKGYGQLTATEVKEIILYSTDNHYFVNPDNLGKLGTGRLNAYNALLETNTTLNNIANPTAFKANSSGPNTILLEWNNNSNNNDIIIAWSLQPINGSPVNGTIYSAGQELSGGGTVLFSGQASQYQHTGLTASTKYHYKIWSKNDVVDYSTGRTCHETSQSCFLEDQCTYTFRLTSIGNGSWADSYMTVEQGGKVLVDLYKFCGTAYFDMEVDLCNALPFQLIWHPGTWGDMMGIEILGPYGNSIFKRPPQSPFPINHPVLFEGITDCSTPTCFAPIGIEVTDYQSTQVTVQWTAVNNEQLFNLEYGPLGYQPGSGTAINSITNNPYILTGLSSGTRYELRVQSDCGDGDISYWSLPVYFETSCTNFGVPIFEDFSDVPYRQIPMCWDRYGSTPNPAYNWEVWGHDRGTLWHNTGKHANLVSPIISHNINQTRMYFDLKWDPYLGNMEIGTSQYINGSYIFTSLESFPSRLMYDFEPAEKQVVYFVDYTGSDQQIAFRLGAEDATNPSWVFIDNIVIEEIPSCPEPYKLNILNNYENAVEMAWVQAGGVQNWEIKIGDIGFDPDAQGLLIQGIQSNTYVLDNLTPASFYEVYIRATCGTDHSIWSQPIIFSTDPGLLSLPHTENFNDCLITQIPPGWRHVGEGMHNAVVLGGWGINSTPGLIMKHSYFESKSILVAPTFETSPDHIKLTFMARSNESNFQIEVGILNDFDDIQTFQAFEVIEIPSNMVYLNYTVYFNQPDAINGNIALRIQGGPDQARTLWLDNFVFEEIPPCAIPVELNAGIIDENSVELGWTQPGFATTWEIIYGSPGFDPQEVGITIANITENPFTLGGLNVNSLYEFRVRKVCNEEHSDWSAAHIFATQCVTYSIPHLENFDLLPSPLLPPCWTYNLTHHQGNIRSLEPWYNNSPNSLEIKTSGGSAYFSAPQFDIPINNIKLSFHYIVHPYNNLEIGVMSDINDITTYQAVYQVEGFTPVWDPVIGTFLFKEQEVYFTGNYDDNSKIVFNAVQNPGAIYLDDIFFEAITACPEPFNIQASNIDVYEATIHWLQAGNVNEWELSFGVRGYDPDLEGIVVSNIINTNYLVEGLQANTAYEIYVRSVCGADFSEWSAPKAITTLPGCQAPNSLNASGITKNEALVSWMHPGSASSWELLYGISGFNPETDGTIITGILSMNYLVNDLQQSQYYDVYIRAICNDETSAWSAPLLFATECGFMNLPFSESFDHNIFENMPLCWNSLYIGEGNGKVEVQGSPFFRLIMENFLNATSFAVLPKINTENIPIKISFKAAHIFENRTVEIGITTNPANPASFIPISIIELPPIPWEFNDFITYIESYDSDLYRIAFKYDQYGAILLDDITVEAAELCVSPYNLNITEIYQNTALLSWSSIGTAESWEIKYGHAGFDPDENGVLITTDEEMEVTLTGLTPGIYFQAFVRSLCDEDVSDWSIPIVFSTECAPVALPYLENFENIYIPPLPPCWDSHIGHGYLSIYQNRLRVDGRAYQSIILALPEFDNPLQALQLDMIAAWGRDRENNFYEVGVISDIEDPSSFQTWETLYFPDNQWYNKSISFTGFSGNPGRIALRFGRADFNFDEIAITFIGLPSINTNQITDITFSTATSGGNITSDGGSAITARGVVWSTSQNPTVTTNEGITTDGTDIGVYTSTLSSLSPTTTYYVRAYATNSAGTAYGEELQFTTSEANKLLDVKLLFEGAFNGTNGMHASLQTAGLIPIAQPYNTSPWDYNGSESVASIPADVVDWVLAELRDADTPENATSATKLEGWPKAMFLKTDGSLVDLDGNLPNIGTPTVNNNLYIVIRHRNHLDVMSSAALTLSGNTYSYDFTDDVTKAHGGAAGYKQIGTGVYGMVAGDIDADGAVFASDFNIWAINFGLTIVYLPADVDMDGQVFASDFNKWAVNFGTNLGRNVGIGYRSQVPK